MQKATAKETARALSRDLSLDWCCSLELSVENFEQFSESIRVCAASTYRSALLVFAVSVVVLNEQLDGFAQLLVRRAQLRV